MFPLLSIILCLLLLISKPAFAEFGDYRDDIGYSRLISKQTGLPDGNGVIVMHNEAASGGNWLPEVSDPPDDPEYIGKTFNSITPGSIGETSHARVTVGYFYYGNLSSIAPGTSTVNVYEANHWINDGFLHVGDSDDPVITPDRVANHS